MSEEQKPPRRPFGERDDEERSLPFGARPTPSHLRPYSTEPPRRDYTESTDDELPEDEQAAYFASAEDAFYEEALFDEPEPPADGEQLPAPEPDEQADRPPSAGVWTRVTAAGSALLKGRGQAAAQADAAPHARPVIQFGVLLRATAAIFATSGILATLFTWWTPNAFLPVESVEQLSVALATQSMMEVAAPPTPVPAVPPTLTPIPHMKRIGIVSGHRGLYPGTGEPDPGAVCADGLTEAEVNEAVARLVVDWMNQSGYSVDLFDEFDPRLQGYEALALLSIHSDSCEYINDLATGFKVASVAESATPEEDARLVACLIDRYSTTTGLAFHPSVTYDMTQYHTFNEIAASTPGAIIEIGFLYLDRELLAEHPDVVALGIARGLLCYLRNEPVTIPPAPAETVAP
jgi:N-acetylmuramoyl-L-alanine amidase